MSAACLPPAERFATSRTRGALAPAKQCRSSKLKMHKQHGMYRMVSSVWHRENNSCLDHHNTRARHIGLSAPADRYKRERLTCNDAGLGAELHREQRGRLWHRKLGRRHLLRLGCRRRRPCRCWRSPPAGRGRKQLPRLLLRWLLLPLRRRRGRLWAHPLGRAGLCSRRRRLLPLLRCASAIGGRLHTPQNRWIDAAGAAVRVPAPDILLAMTKDSILQACLGCGRSGCAVGGGHDAAWLLHRCRPCHFGAGPPQSGLLATCPHACIQRSLQAHSSGLYTVVIQNAMTCCATLDNNST